MKVSIQSVKDGGDLSNERVLIKVTADTDIGRYLLGRSRYVAENSLSPKLTRTFWLPDKPVKQGDFVLVYTKAGVDGQFNNKSDSITHTFYVNADAPIWTSEDTGVVLFEVGDWESKKVLEQK